MRKIIHKTSLHFAGWMLVLLGVLGFFLPILPGILLVALGVYFISLASLRLSLKIDVLKTRYPNIGRHVDRFDQLISRFIKKAH